VAGERWKPIPGHKLLGIPAGYEASSEGRVRSPRQVLTQRLNGDGYPVVKVGGRWVRVALLVQLAWAGPPEVLHLDDDRENSCPSNLKWGSRVENEQMKRKTGRNGGTEGSCCRQFPSVTPVTGDLPG
jgi:hypothetical protein